MMANDSIEIATTVNSARINRLIRYPSIVRPFVGVGCWVSGVGAGGPTPVVLQDPTPITHGPRSALEIPGWRQRRAGRPSVLTVELARRNVPEVVLDDPHPHHGRREADCPDRPGLLDGDLPD